MNRTLCFLICTLLPVLSACVHHDYLGETYQPTQSVQSFYDEKDVPAGYKTIGEHRVQASKLVSTQQIHDEIIQQAQSKGADAVLFQGLSSTKTGEYTFKNGQVDKNGNWTESSNTSSQSAKVVNAKFLKKIQ